MKWPKVLYVDPGKELLGAVSQLLRKHSVAVRRGVAGAEGAHREQSIVEHFNQILVEHLFGHQYAQEMLFPRAPKEGQRFTEWVQRLPAVVAALKCEATRLTGRKPVEAIKLKNTAQKPSYVYHRPIGLEEQKLPSGVGVCFLYQPGEFEGGRHRATDPVWSLNVYRLGQSVTKPDEPVLFQGYDAPQRGSVWDELLVGPKDTQVPP